MKSFKAFGNIFLLTFAFLLVCKETNAQKSERIKPRWIAETPQPTNPTYDFIVVRAWGDSPQSASQACLDKLMTNEDLRTSVRAIVDRNRTSVQQQDIRNGKLTEHISNTVTVNVTMNGKEIKVTANPIDEYWEYTSLGGNRSCECYTLYMVAVSNIPPVYDVVSFTQYYGMKGFARSLIPGWGQIYKGSMKKGLGILGGEAACVAGIIVCENLRASYVKKMKEQPKFAQTYNSKADNWKNGRNICIGAAAALYVYNLIDAVASKGAKRIIVKPRREIRFSMAPIALDNGVGVGLALNF